MVNQPAQRRPANLVLSSDGIVCFEGAWSENFASRDSVEPALRCLESFGMASVVHRDVATRDELAVYLDQWFNFKPRKGDPDFRIGMFAFHGDREVISLGADVINLDDLEAMIAGRAQGKILYIGGCNVLDVGEDRLMQFCRRTKAKGLIGYTKAVPMVETIAFEMLLINHVLTRSSFKPMYSSLVREHLTWVKKMGLRMASGSWASPKRITQKSAGL